MNKELISRYLHGEVTEQERALMQEWIETQGASWMDDYLDRQWENATVTTSVAHKEQLADRVLAAVQQHSTTERIQAAASHRPVRLLVRWVAAACLLITAGTLSWQWWYRTAASGHALSWQTIRNEQPGSIKRVYLPDSSLVTIHAGSSIRFASNYNDTSRELELNGEALFEVRHNALRPFRVHASQLTTRVYGTVFNIAAYSDAGELRVALKKGRIGVSQTDNAVGEQILQPGELLLYNKATHASYTDHLPVDEIGSWTQGTLAFYKTPLKDALTMLEKQYGVTFTYEPSLQNKTITASFDKAPLKQVLAHLSFVWNMQFHQEKNTIHVQ